MSKLTLIHLYPEEMNIYGDMGNILTLKRRCEWRGIEFEYNTLSFDTKEIPLGDIYFMGGGQDNDMYKVFEDLQVRKLQLSKIVDEGKVFLLICGGLQLFGNYFLDAKGREIRGLGLLPLTTKAPGNKLEDRCLGNLASKITPEIREIIEDYYTDIFSDYFIGFENHGGQTFFDDKSEIHHIGEVVIGKGNNAKQRIEGAYKKSIFASYSHGSLLPKNPHLADMLIGKALESQSGQKVELEPLDDSIEWEAHYAMLRKLGIN